MVDSVVFFGGRIPTEVEVMSKHLKDLDKESFRKILKVVVNAVEGKDCSGAMADIAQNSPLSEEKFSHIVSGMYELLKEALRLPTSSLKQEGFKEDLRGLRISEEFIADFASVVFGNRRSAIDAVVKQQGPRLPSLEEFRWRVDVAISTSSLARALQPSLLMQLKLSDGNVHRFEINKYVKDDSQSKVHYGILKMVPVSKFQELRYNVALILKEMNDLEKRSILKIQD